MKLKFIVLNVAAILLVLILIQGVQAAENYNYVLQWGSFDPAPGNSNVNNGKFAYPGGVAVDSSGFVYVADTSNHRIQKFDSCGNFVTKWGSFYSSENGQFEFPEDVAVDSSGFVYVADTGNSRIQKFDSRGTFVAKWGTRGSGNGQFSSPNSITVDSSGSVYVADTGNSRIQKFDSRGTFVAKWGTWGSGNGQFLNPNGITGDSSGFVYVADTGNSRIQKFDPSGTFVTKWGSEGAGDGQFSGPNGIAVDASGFVYVTDLNNKRIQKFDPDGTFVTKWGSSGSGEGEFDGPTDVIIDSSGFVYVVDRNNHRIQKFVKVLTTGSLSVTSDPSSAEIYLDGNPAGLVTPFTLTDISPGSHTVNVSSVGYTTTEQHVLVTAGEITPVFFPMVCISPGGTLVITSDPSSAEISLDGEMTGQVTPFILTGVNSGSHRVNISHAGYCDADQQVDMSDGMTVPLFFHMIPKLQAGLLSVTSNPVGASIWIDGKDTGQVTPYTFDNDYGNYDVVVQMICYTTPDPQIVSVSPAATATADFVFQSDGTCTNAPEFPSPTVPAAVMVGCFGLIIVLASRKK